MTGKTCRCCALLALLCATPQGRRIQPPRGKAGESLLDASFSPLQQPHGLQQATSSGFWPFGPFKIPIPHMPPPLPWPPMPNMPMWKSTQGRPSSRTRSGPLRAAASDFADAPWDESAEEGEVKMRPFTERFPPDALDMTAIHATAGVGHLDNPKIWHTPPEEVVHPPALHTVVERTKHNDGPATGTASAVGTQVGLVEVTARGELNGQTGWHDILLPSTWVEKLDPSTITVWHDAQARYPFYVGEARLVNSPHRSVTFSAMPTGDIETERDITFARLLGTTGFAPEFIESQAFSDVTFSLTESPGTEQLSALIDERMSEATRAEAPLMPVGESVALMSDLLESAATLENAGIVHGDLSEKNIFIVDGGSHAILTDFHKSCLSEGITGDLGCSLEQGEVVGSAFRQAPEMEDEHTETVSNNVWQLGLVFARMLFGGEVPTMVQVRRAFPLDDFDDTTADGRRRIRELVRKAFSPKEMDGYRKLSPQYKDLLQIVDGMLEKDPKKRWSAAKALQAVQGIAQRREVFLPMPREPSAVTEEWLLAWQ